MNRFKNLSIRRKLIAISMFTSGVALTFAMVVLLIGAFFATRATIQERIDSLARVIGTNCTASLTFDDPDAARETLKALTAEPEIAYARVYTADGSLFAAYEGRRSDRGRRYRGSGEYGQTPHLKTIDTASTIRFAEGALNIIEPIRLDDRVIGAVEVSSDLKALYRRLQLVALICLGVLLIAIFMAYIVSARMQRTISEPVGTLTDVMKKVSRNKDYSVRVHSVSQDELGMLFTGFNQMLTEIQARDQKLYFTQFSVDHMADAGFWMDAGGNIVNINHAAVTALGYSREKLIGKPIGDIDPELGPQGWAGIWEQARKRKQITFEACHFSRDGRSIPVEVFANFLSFQGHDYLCAFARDIADRKALQFQLEQAQKMEAIGTLAGGVAHDLNNVLGGLVGYPELLLSEMTADDPLHRPLSIIKKSGEKAAAIVQDMLTLARRNVDLRSAVNLNHIVSDYLKSPEHEKVAQFHTNVTFDVQTDPELPNILGSEIHLSKTIMNLVSNAAEAMPDGGRVLIGTFYSQLNETLRGFQAIPKGDYAVLRVEDNGLGVSAADLAKIFEPFYTKKKMGRSGTGLGMTVVSGTVKDHRGFIDLKSMPGHGTRFDLYFPMTRMMLEEQTDTFVMEDFKGSERILVVDDVQEQREVAQMILTKLGYQVETATSGETALAYVQHQRADLLVLDMIMDAGMDGLKTYQ
ncbi:MAG: PAS domain S-box protein, partial [Desulfatitalea sp.]|nr:PAS domain S-box protein [Desulfatitalea sp.]NNJ99489.1 PAS domain S-box protein [Desulfatitalea sp.]